MGGTALVFHALFQGAKAGDVSDRCKKAGELESTSYSSACAAPKTIPLKDILTAMPPDNAWFEANYSLVAT